MKIVLDIGHGGSDPGASHYTADNVLVTEHQIVSEIAPAAIMLLSRAIGEDNVAFIAAGQQSMTLGDRAKRIAAYLNQGFDLIVSLHMNKAADISATGVECYYLDGNDAGHNKAKKLVDEYAEQTGLRNRGAKPDTATHVGGLAIMRKPEVEMTLRQDRVLLLECGFLSNDNDLAVVRKKAPYAIAKSIMAALGNDNWVPDEPQPVFPDVPFTHFAHDAISRMQEAGILNGYGDGIFRPDHYMTRGEVAVALDRLYNAFNNAKTRLPSKGEIT